MKGVEVFEQDTEDWNRARRLFDASLDRRPSRVLRPGSLADAIGLVRSLQEDGQPYTLKSGGHSAAGLSVLDGVQLVDLSRIRKVRVDSRNSLVTLEGGALLLDLDKATAELGMATTSGTVSHTGVVGLACGGGLGWLMGRFGLACDNIAQATIVRSGEVEVLTESSPEMLVLRGSGISLGFVAELTMRIYPIEREFCWSALELLPDRIIEGFRLLQDLVVDIPESAGCSFTIQSDPSGKTTGIIDVIAPCNRHEVAAWSRRLMALVNRRRDTFTDYLHIQQAFDPEFVFGKRSYRRSLCLDQIDPETISGLLAELRMTSTYYRSVTLDILHDKALDRVNSLASSFVRRRFVALLVCQWPSAELDVDGRDHGRYMFRLLSDYQPSERYEAYGNYSSEPADSKGFL